MTNERQSITFPTETSVDRMWSKVEPRIRLDKKRGRRTAITLAAAVAGFTLIGGTAAYATYAVNNPSAMPSHKYLVSQHRLVKVVNAVEAAVAGGGTDMAGFAGVALNTSADKVDLYWNGSVPASVQSIIDDNSSVKIVLHSVSYSYSELRAGTERLAKWGESGGLGATGRIVAISTPITGTGIVVVVSATTSGAAPSDFQESVATAAGVPVEIKVEQPGNHDLEWKQAAITSGK